MLTWMKLEYQLHQMIIEFTRIQYYKNQRRQHALPLRNQRTPIYIVHLFKNWKLIIYHLKTSSIKHWQSSPLQGVTKESTTTAGTAETENMGWSHAVGRVSLLWFNRERWKIHSQWKLPVVCKASNSSIWSSISIESSNDWFTSALAKAFTWLSFNLKFPGIELFWNLFLFISHTNACLSKKKEIKKWRRA